MPPTEGRPPLRNVSGTPHDSEVVDFILRLIVGHEDVEISAAYAVQHVQDGLLSGPRPMGLFTVEGVGARHTSIRPSRTGGFIKGRTATEGEDSHEKVGGQIGNRSALTEFVSQTFRQTFDRSFGCVIGSITATIKSLRNRHSLDSKRTNGGFVTPASVDVSENEAFISNQADLV